MTAIEQAKLVKDAAKDINTATTSQKNKALKEIKNILILNENRILEQNKRDIESAKQSGLQEHLIDRLTLNSDRIKSMVSAIDELIHLADPVGEIIDGTTRPNGLKIERVRVPLGVIGIIYEARPNVSVDAATLCLKSGNAVLLRGGKEAIYTNTVLVNLMKDALKNCNINPNSIELVTDTSRESANQMMKMRGVLDVLIPRGSASLIKSVTSNSTVPVIETGTGNCHIYVDESADLDMALKITLNAKVSRPSVCNSAESLLVHCLVAKPFLKMLKKEFDSAGVTLVGCANSRKILPDIELAIDDDFYTEYLDYKMSVKIVDNIEQAVDHIEKYSSKHSECIVTSNYEASEYFLSAVDSSAVYV
ncbi:MAG: glutamate-5-semialdehyde dehydrogenase, partial [Oscillospiraceae bacterium]|nr:glutamate-5-semialdehyde dehydrogenase [Oscillospiraceae bacterium]